MIEAINKIIKHQFLYPKEILDRKKLEIILEKTIYIYNTIRPQMSLQGSTPAQTFQGKPMNFSIYSQRFKAKKVIRIQENRKSECRKCLYHLGTSF